MRKKHKKRKMRNNFALELPFLGTLRIYIGKIIVLESFLGTLRIYIGKIIVLQSLM